jgi:hypothetical protein
LGFILISLDCLLGLGLMLCSFVSVVDKIYIINSVGDMNIKLCLLNGCCIFLVLLGVGLIVIESFYLEGLIRDQAE